MWWQCGDRVASQNTRIAKSKSTSMPLACQFVRLYSAKDEKLFAATLDNTRILSKFILNYLEIQILKFKVTINRTRAFSPKRAISDLLLSFLLENLLYRISSLLFRPDDNQLESRWSRKPVRLAFWCNRAKEQSCRRNG